MESIGFAMSQVFEFKEDFYRNNNVLWLNNFLSKDLSYLKSSTDVFWSKSHKKYYILNTLENRKHIAKKNPLSGKVVLSKIQELNLVAYYDFQNHLILKSYSKNTIRTYCNEFAQLLYVLKSYDVKRLNEDKIRSYLVYCAEELKLSENQIHSRINALKFYFEQVLGRQKMFLSIPRPKKPLLLPKHLAAKEVKRILEVIENIKHSLIIKFCYGMGLRVSEIAALKLEHINTKDFKVLISSAKGKKDRYVYLPESVLPDIKKYYNQYFPETYLFEGTPGNPLSIRTIQTVFKNSMKKAGIDRNVGIHCLRHSYATHLLEFGTDISHIQKLLGHNNIKTTLNYTMVTDKNLSRIISPLDRFSQ